MAYSRESFSSDAFSSDAYEGLAAPSAQTWNAWRRAWGKSWRVAWGVLLDTPYESLLPDQQVTVRSILSRCYVQSQAEQVLFTATKNHVSVRSAAVSLGIATAIDDFLAGNLPQEILVSSRKDEQSTNVVLDTARVSSTARRMSVGATNGSVSVSTSRTDLRSTP